VEVEADFVEECEWGLLEAIELIDAIIIDLDMDIRIEVDIIMDMEEGEYLEG
jgi:hypothetical protein